MRYIFGTPLIDISIFFLPGFLCLAFFLQQAPLSESLLLSLATLLILGVLDAGHVYTSLWRTYFYSEEFKRKPLFYIVTPILVFLFFLLWVIFGKAFLLGNFIFYAAVHHNFKQFAGVSKWYQKINSCYSAKSNILFVLLCVIPLVGLHFRESAGLNFLNLELLTLFPDAQLAFCSRILYGFVFVLWLAFEVRDFKVLGVINIFRIFSIGLPALLYGLCFLYGQGVEQVLFPLVAAHGVAYIALIVKSTKALKITRFWKHSALLVVFTAIVFGLFVLLFAPNRADLKTSVIVQAVLGAVFLTPLFCHYIYDSYLWLSSHPDSARIAKP